VREQRYAETHDGRANDRRGVGVPVGRQDGHHAEQHERDADAAEDAADLPGRSRGVPRRHRHLGRDEDPRHDEQRARDERTHTEIEPTRVDPGAPPSAVRLRETGHG